MIGPSLRSPQTHKPRVLITRAPHQASPLAEALRALGADPVLIATIEIAPPTSYATLDAAVASLESFDWLVLTSPNAIAPLAERMKLQGVALPHSLRLAAIGTATARELAARFGIAEERVLLPPQAVAESLAESLLPFARREDGSSTRFLLDRAEDARDILPRELLAAGAEVVLAAAYRNIVPQNASTQLRELLCSAPPDAITFTSASTAKHLFALLDEASLALPPATVLASIGPITSAALRDLGHPAHIESTEASVQRLASDLMHYLNTDRTTATQP
jgi:uroporphyrinogen-III synthase